MTAEGSDGEYLPEFMGRMCYRSFAPGLNANVTKVRQGNDKYLANILRSGHGSVLEHVCTNWVFSSVSRVFTHELVRHRVGTAISQESLRYVRLDDLDYYVPQCFLENEQALGTWNVVMCFLEEKQKELAEIFNLDGMKNFTKKKEITSAMRRLAPIGLATTIGWSANLRTLRTVIEQRTSAHAEEEIRLVFQEVARICQREWPNVFQDMAFTDNGEAVFENKKI